MNLLNLPTDILGKIFENIELGNDLRALANCVQVFTKVHKINTSRVYQVVLEVNVANDVPIYIQDGFCLGKIPFRETIPERCLSYDEEVKGHIFCIPKNINVVEFTIFKYNTLYGYFKMNNQLPNYEIVTKKYEAVCTYVINILKNKPPIRKKFFLPDHYVYLSPKNHTYDLNLSF